MAKARGIRDLISNLVMDVEARPDYMLHLTFANGEKRVFDARPLLEEPIYEPLKDMEFFQRARKECGSVVWSDEIDIAPEYLFEQSRLEEAE